MPYVIIAGPALDPKTLHACTVTDRNPHTKLSKWRTIESRNTGRLRARGLAGGDGVCLHSAQAFPASHTTGPTTPNE
jgi:hypothetical protein